MAYAKDIDIYLERNFGKCHVIIDGIEVPATSVEIFHNGDKFDVKVGLLVTNARIRVEDPQVEIVDGKLVVHEESPKKIYSQKGETRE